jgi:V/A-type H+/Na+-transporting ATPase subunit B
MRKYFDEIVRIAGSVITVKASGVGYEELGIITGDHDSSLAQVIRLDDELVSAQVFTGTHGLSTEDRIRFLGKPMQVAFGDGVLGRIFDGAGG